jgi:hypothetical protein
MTGFKHTGFAFLSLLASKIWRKTGRHFPTIGVNEDHSRRREQRMHQ